MTILLFRQTGQAVWEKAVQFIQDYESRVRIVMETIDGDEYAVWKWVQVLFEGNYFDKLYSVMCLSVHSVWMELWISYIGESDVSYMS